MTAQDPPGFREIATDAIRFWEWGRLGYNLLLASITLIMLRGDILHYGLVLFVYAVIANILYSSVYVPDVFIQLSSFRPLWRKLRWIVWLVGTLFAAIMTFALLFSLAFNGWT